jgi:hypothetical protein
MPLTLTLPPVELLAALAAVLEAGDRAGYQGGHGVDPPANLSITSIARRDDLRPWSGQ